MPFPLSHPVAVLPLRKWFPRGLSFLGLAVGSVTPDLGYALNGRFHLADFSHGMPGSFAFCLPIGLLSVYVILILRRSLVSTLPSPHRQALLPLTTSRWPAWWRIALSILIGAWTHILFDNGMHRSFWSASEVDSKDEWALAAAQKPLYQGVWVVVSSVSMLILAGYYVRFLRRTTGRRSLFDPHDRRRLWRWVALLAMPYLIVAPFSYRCFESEGFTFNRHTIYLSLEPYLLLVTVEVVLFGGWIGWRQRVTQPPATGSSDTPVPPA